MRSCAVSEDVHPICEGMRVPSVDLGRRHVEVISSKLAAIELLGCFGSLALCDDIAAEERAEEPALETSLRSFR
jgi:hypothetical protein